MIDRSYLPFQSARDYQDPGMQKWMGFFLSEHTSSLSEEKNRVDLSTDLYRVERARATSQQESIDTIFFFTERARML